MKIYQLLTCLWLAALARGFTPTAQTPLTTRTSCITSANHPYRPFHQHDVSHPPTSSPTQLFMTKKEVDIEDDGDEIIIRRPNLDTLVEQIAFRIRRISWFSWWSQVILTTVASVTLLFTRNVLNLQSSTVDRNLLPNYFLAGTSIGLGFVSIFWTWATRRLSRRLLRKPTSKIQAANMLRKDIHVGTIINLLGMAFALFGAEQIVGGLAIKVLTTSTSSPAIYSGANSLSLLQPLDILVVQANTNNLFSHFCSLVSYLWLGRSIDKLDPPSTDKKQR